LSRENFPARPGRRILKGASAGEITAALRTVAAGGAVFGPGIASRLLARTPTRASGPAPPSQDDLTARERTLPEVSLKTVQNHVSHILDKLQAADRTQAALRARGITPSPH
jgi:DNA-binding NarL/FixJ family response regulator